MIKLVNRTNTRKQLVEHLFEAILQGELKPGERIAEVSFARQLGVGQSTLREALQELEHQGLVTKYENRATFVSTLTTKDVEDIYCVRLELEPMAGALACARFTPEHADQLGLFLNSMQTALGARDIAGMVKSDLAFHQFIWKLSDNRSLEKSLNLICMPLFAFYEVRLSYFKAAPQEILCDLTQDREEHSDVLKVLGEGNPENVRRVFREKLEVFRTRHIQNVRAVEQEEERLRETAAKDVTARNHRGNWA
jgi:DNA-binding GntR family transcriptional regulator